MVIVIIVFIATIFINVNELQHYDIYDITVLRFTAPGSHAENHLRLIHNAEFAVIREFRRQV